MATYLQNIMTGAVDEFSTWGEAFDEQVRRNVREHWSLFTSRPEAFEPPVVIDMSDYVEPADIKGSFDRQSHWNGEYARRKAAVLGATLARIEGADDITRFLNAAE